MNNKIDFEVILSRIESMEDTLILLHNETSKRLTIMEKTSNEQLKEIGKINGIVCSNVDYIIDHKKLHISDNEKKWKTIKIVSVLITSVITIVSTVIVV